MKKMIVYIRVGQAIFLGIFILGISMIFGDLLEIVQLPISAVSLTTTSFGGAGSLVCEMFARKAEKW